MTLTVGSLFSGIGGLDLGLERAGMRVIWQSEIDPYACKVLSKHWPEVANHGNIKEINWQEVKRPDVICGGYPCQPFSTAGKRRGEEDPRHLWPWVREAISELRPRYAILENVRGHLSMGGLSVVAELASIGYDAEWRVVSAASVGANHRRDRIIIVAYPNDSRPHRTQIDSTDTGVDALCGFGRCCEDVAYTNDTRNGTPRSDIDRNGQAIEQGRQVFAQSRSCGCGEIVADPNSNNSTNGRQCQALQGESASGGDDRSGSGSNTWEISVGSSRKTSSDMANPNGGRCEQCKPETKPIQRISSSSERRTTDIAKWWQTEPDVGRVANGVPARVDRLRGLGNAVVPQVAEVIGRLVVAHAG